MNLRRPLARRGVFAPVFGGLLSFIAVAALAGCTGSTGARSLDEIDGLASPAPAHATSQAPDVFALQNMVDAYQQSHQIPGLAVAVVSPQPGQLPGSAPSVQYLVAGKPDLTSPALVTPLTQFEIASETKTFTAALLATLIAQGKVQLDDPIQKYAPMGVTVPTWTQDGKTTQITLRDLATHQSGLPDTPRNFTAGCPNTQDCPDAATLYSRDLLWQGLQSTTLPWQPGTKWLYSNFAFGILGTILADLVAPGNSGQAYGAVLQSQVLSAVPMPSTQLEQTPNAQLATPYHDGVPTRYNGDNNALAGGGGLTSNITDMATWASVVLGYSIDGASSASTQTLRQTLTQAAAITTHCDTPTSCSPAKFNMGLAWQLYPADSDIAAPYINKDGGSIGMSSMTYLVPTRGIAVTILANSNAGVGTLGMQLTAQLVNPK